MSDSAGQEKEFSGLGLYMFRTTKSPTRADSTETRLLMKENLSDTGEFFVWEG